MDAAVTYAHARRAFNHKVSNPAFDRVFAAARDIKLTHSDGGQAFFSSLLDHELDQIALTAAFLLVPLIPSRARKALETLRKSDYAEVSFAAKVTLEEWQKGRLDTDWFMK